MLSSGEVDMETVGSKGAANLTAQCDRAKSVFLEHGGMDLVLALMRKPSGGNETLCYASITLLNLSSYVVQQHAICKSALLDLLHTNSRFTGVLSSPSVACGKPRGMQTGMCAHRPCALSLQEYCRSVLCVRSVCDGEGIFWQAWACVCSKTRHPRVLAGLRAREGKTTSCSPTDVPCTQHDPKTPAQLLMENSCPRPNFRTREAICL